MRNREPFLNLHCICGKCLAVPFGITVDIPFACSYCYQSYRINFQTIRYEIMTGEDDLS